MIRLQGYSLRKVMVSRRRDERRIGCDCRQVRHAGRFCLQAARPPSAPNARRFILASARQRAPRPAQFSSVFHTLRRRERFDRRSPGKLGRRPGVDASGRFLVARNAAPRCRATPSVGTWPSRRPPGRECAGECSQVLFEPGGGTRHIVGRQPMRPVDRLQLAVGSLEERLARQGMLEGAQRVGRADDR